ncbi:MAG: type I 3-dehydroquinate dehydratase [Thaumarchaeota archaeon]|nr:type I 3-dehydroquinate dehydratase [Nitrososphaerota archaeon]
MADLKSRTSFGVRSAGSKICVSIYGRTLTELGSKLRLARKFRPSFIELRLDYLHEPDLDDISRIAKVLVGSEILTFRSKGEGGAARISEQKRLEIIHAIVSCKPPYLDLEVATLDSHPDLIERVEASGSKLIASSHDFSSLEGLDDLKNLVRRVSKLTPLYAIKIVRRARIFDDNQRILSLYWLASEIAPIKLIAFCAGPLGVLSRVACVENGSPLTFTSLPNEKTAPGQLEVQTMQTLFSYW